MSNRITPAVLVSRHAVNTLVAPASASILSGPSMYSKVAEISRRPGESLVPTGHRGFVTTSSHLCCNVYKRGDRVCRSRGRCSESLGVTSAPHFAETRGPPNASFHQWQSQTGCTACAWRFSTCSYVWYWGTMHTSAVISRLTNELIWRYTHR